MLEPVFLIPEGPMKPTEYGKQWMYRVWSDLDHHSNTLRDVYALSELEHRRWDLLEQLLKDEGVPTNLTSGVSQYGMAKLIDHLNGKTPFVMPTTVAMALATAAPTSTTTGTTVTEAAYTGYARVAIPGAGFNAASAATPSVSSNNGVITFGNCTAGTSNLAGFIIVDATALTTGNALWYGTLSAVTISTTQTPPTVANAAMSLSMTGT